MLFWAVMVTPLRSVALGELNHPQSASINYERACHRITSLKQEDNTWIGESIILCSNPQHGIHGTPLGEVLASVIQHGGKPGMSTRGVGSINEDGSVDKEFVLVTVDLVSDPSGPGCFVAGILESKEFVINTHGEIYEVRYNEFEKGIAKIPSGSSTTSVGSEHIKNLIESFLNDFGK